MDLYTNVWCNNSMILEMHDAYHVLWCRVSVKKEILEFRRMIGENALGVRFEHVTSLIYTYLRRVCRRSVMLSNQAAG